MLAIDPSGIVSREMDCSTVAAPVFLTGVINKGLRDTTEGVTTGCEDLSTASVFVTAGALVTGGRVSFLNMLTEGGLGGSDASIGGMEEIAWLSVLSVKLLSATLSCRVGVAVGGFLVTRLNISPFRGGSSSVVLCISGDGLSFPKGPSSCPLTTDRGREKLESVNGGFTPEL